VPRTTASYSACCARGLPERRRDRHRRKGCADRWGSALAGLPTDPCRSDRPRDRGRRPDRCRESTARGAAVQAAAAVTGVPIRELQRTWAPADAGGGPTPSRYRARPCRAARRYRTLADWTAFDHLGGTHERGRRRPGDDSAVFQLHAGEAAARSRGDLAGSIYAVPAAGPGRRRPPAGRAAAWVHADVFADARHGVSLDLIVALAGGGIGRSTSTCSPPTHWRPSTSSAVRHHPDHVPVRGRRRCRRRCRPIVLGRPALLAISPGTTLARCADALATVDGVLVMLLEPGNQGVVGPHAAGQGRRGPRAAPGRPSTAESARPT